MSTGRNIADIYFHTGKEPYIGSNISTSMYHCFFNTNKSQGLHDSGFLVQMSPEFICLMAPALQWHLPIYIATGKVVQALQFNSVDADGEWSFQRWLQSNSPLQQ